MSARHGSGKSVEQYTPKAILDAARWALHGTRGGKVATLDPATTREVNADRVQAPHYFTRETDGLARVWAADTVFVNPPSPAAEWWAKAVTEFRADRARAVVFVAFSIELFQTAQNANYGALTSAADAYWRNAVRDWHPLHFTHCIPHKRVAYDQRIEDRIAALRASADKARKEDKIDKAQEIDVRVGGLLFKQSEGVRYVSGDSPPHSSAIILLSHDLDMQRRFRSAFCGMGIVEGGALAGGRSA